MPNFVQIGQSVAEILRFFKMAAAAILDCRIHKISLAVSGHMAQTHHFAKFREKLVVPLRTCCNLSYFQDDHRRHLGFLKSRNFIGYSGDEGWDVSACQILSKSVNRSQRYDFSIFQDGGRRYLGFSKSWIFICWRYLECAGALLYQSLSKSVVPLRRYCDFSHFQDGRRRHLGFLKSRNFIGY